MSFQNAGGKAHLKAPPLPHHMHKQVQPGNVAPCLAHHEGSHSDLRFSPSILKGASLEEHSFEAMCQLAEGQHRREEELTPAQAHLRGCPHSILSSLYLGTLCQSTRRLTFGLASLGVKVEGRAELVARRLGAVAAAEDGPVVGLVAFLFWPGVAEAGRLVGAAVVGTGLVFAAADFTAGVEAEGLTLKTHKQAENGHNTEITKRKRSA